MKILFMFKTIILETIERAAGFLEKAYYEEIDSIDNFYRQYR